MVSPLRSHAYDGKFSLAPVYDMLPMLYAPEHEELPARKFEAPAPSAESLTVYGRARALAEKYWDACARDARIGKEFRAVCAGNLETLRALPSTGVYQSS